MEKDVEKRGIREVRKGSVMRFKAMDFMRVVNPIYVSIRIPIYLFVYNFIIYLLCIADDIPIINPSFNASSPLMVLPVNKRYAAAFPYNQKHIEFSAIIP